MKLGAEEMEVVGEGEICRYFRSMAFLLNISEISGRKVSKSYIFPLYFTVIKKSIKDTFLGTFYKNDTILIFQNCS